MWHWYNLSTVFWEALQFPCSLCIPMRSVWRSREHSNSALQSQLDHQRVTLPLPLLFTHVWHRTSAQSSTGVVKNRVSPDPLPPIDKKTLIISKTIDYPASDHIHWWGARRTMINELEWWHPKDSNFTHSLHRKTRRRFEGLEQPQCTGDQREGLTRCCCRRPPKSSRTRKETGIYLLRWANDGGWKTRNSFTH
jgi:hypothetical protein